MIRKTFVVGWDGASIGLVKRWAAEGRLPTLQRMMDEGAYGTLLSTIPMHSPTAWSTFMTGLNPGAHGVFDFTRRAEGSYDFRLVQSHHIDGATIWDWLGQAGRKVGVMNVPMTYPPQPVNGFMISGLGTPSFKPYTYPADLENRLRQLGYKVNREIAYRPGSEASFLDEVYDITERRTVAAEWLMLNQPWDVFMLVYRSTDDLSHFFWRYMDATHPMHDSRAPERFKNAIREFYSYLDRQLGRLIAAAGADTDVIVMSDHGAGPLHKDVYLNEFFESRGWLRLKTHVSGPEARYRVMRKVGLTRDGVSRMFQKMRLHKFEKLLKNALGGHIRALPVDARPDVSFSIDWKATSVFSVGYYGQIYLNVEGREPLGIVSRGSAFEECRELVIRALIELTDADTKMQIVERVYRKEELYTGTHFDEAPDLVVIMREGTYMTRRGYEFSSERRKYMGTPVTGESGSHRLEGILLAFGPGIAKAGALPDQHIVDLAPTIMALQGCSLPTGIDGHVIKQIISSEALVPDQEPANSRYARTTASSPTWSEEDERDVKQRLKDLGYLE